MSIAEIKGAWRAVTRAPGYALVAIVVLAVGIGATTTVYAVLKGVVLNPLPYPEQHELVRIRESKLPQFPTFSVAPGKFMIWERDSTSFEHMFMYRGATLNMTGRETPQRMVGIASTVGLFETLGVSPVLGRGFDETDLVDGASPVVLSHGTWMTHFGGDPTVIGTAVMLNDTSYTIIGVMPPMIDFPSPAVQMFTLWPLGPDEAQQIGAHYTGVVARLKDGRTLDGAHAELNTIAERLDDEYPAQSMGWRVLTESLAESMLGRAGERLYLLLGGVVLVLLITCANVASLTLVRTAGRVHEFAIRRTQGASNASIARQLFIEGAMLALAGGAIGAALAASALPLIRAAAPAGMPRIEQIVLDPAVLVIALAVSLAAGVLAAAVPAMLASRRAVALDLRDGGRGAVGARGRGRGLLVSTEVALAVVLLAAAAVLGRSLSELSSVDPGFAADTSVYTRIELPRARYELERTEPLFREVAERAAALPGVHAAGLVQALPMVDDYVLTLEFEGRPEPLPGESENAIYYAISPGYLDAMGIPLVRGRGILPTDSADAPQVVLVSESFAAQHYPGEDALGKRINIGRGDEWREIVGVVADVRQYGLDARLEPQVYAAFAQVPFYTAFLVVGSSMPPASLTGPVRAIVANIDADQPVGELRSLARVIEDSLADRRFAAWLIGGFAATALLLAAIGLYGTLAYSVRQTVREIGVRLALGARRADVMRGVLKHGMALAGIGAMAGLVIAVIGARVLESFVFGVSARDPATLTAIIALMLAVAFAASALPAWRATRINPMEALRNE
ncbi:MAG: ABC transporter permease [Gammaproteobacteria bacterium]